MKKIVKCLLVFFLTFLTFQMGGQKALADKLIAMDGQDLLVPIHLSLGSVVQLPKSVTTVTPSALFSIEAVSASQLDVKTFLIKPTAAQTATQTLEPVSETVTFVLSNGKSISLKLVSSHKAEKYYEISLEAPKSKPKEFLVSEIQMMKAMILDESGGFSREIVEEKVPSSIPSLEFTLSRIYKSNENYGYVFLVKNDSSKPIKLIPSQFALGKPNIAILSHFSKDTLGECYLISLSSSCSALLRIVTKKTSKLPNLVSNNPAPFSKGEAK